MNKISDEFSHIQPAWRRSRLRRMRDGLCVKCPERAVTKEYCSKHRDQVNQYKRKWSARQGVIEPKPYKRLTKATRHKRRRISHGKCVDCNEPRVSKWYCSAHLERHREAERRRRASGISSDEFERRLVEKFKRMGWD